LARQDRSIRSIRRRQLSMVLLPSTI
jgi:hypothetical protein